MLLPVLTRTITAINTISAEMYNKAFHSGNLSQHSFLVTGGAGFIGSHLVEYLVKYGAGRIVVVDDLSTGNLKNIEAYLDKVTFRQADVNDITLMEKALEGIDFVLHQAALGSVPRSIKDPLSTHHSNATGFLSMLESSRKSGVKKVVYASSSSVYGDSPELPKVEERIGNPKSPYAITKLMDEKYAELYCKLHGLNIVGLRYFNIFGPRQNPNGPYAAAIPLFILEALSNGRPIVFGDGEQSRDFTFVENAVQANIKALFSTNDSSGQVFNIACGERYSLNEVISTIERITGRKLNTIYKAERGGDIRDSHASIAKAESLLNYHPVVKLEEGLRMTIDWYKKNHGFFKA